MERHDKVLFCCFSFISIISLEYMCRFHQLCLGSPLRSEMEAQNHKEKKNPTTLRRPSAPVKANFLPATQLLLCFSVFIQSPLIWLIENLNERFVFCFTPVT